MRTSRTFRTLALLAIAFTLAAAGCYNGKGTDSGSDNQAVTQSSAPAQPASSGLPAGVSSSPNTYSGIYLDKSMTEPCCWLQQSAVFQTHVPANATSLKLTVNVPALDVYKREAQTVAVTVDGKSKDFPGLHVGNHVLVVPLTAARGERDVTVRLQMGFEFTPKGEHINDDTRTLSIYLTSVAAT